MNFGSKARRLVCLFLLVPAANGCEAFHGYRPVGVLVRDIETKKPISGAEVRVSYPLADSPWAPSTCTGLAEGAGIAQVRAAPFGEASLRLETSAKGYLPEREFLKVAAIQQIEPAHWFERVDRRPPAFVVDLYAEPDFSVELIVPVGYRGLITTELQVSENATFPMGQRSFRFEVPFSGNVQLPGPPPLSRLSAPAYHASYADGTRLDGQMDEVKVGFRWVKTEGGREYFVVGTQAEYRKFCHELLSELKFGESRSSTGEKSGGRGGRRRRGDNMGP
jgi:hypothetical protein